MLAVTTVLEPIVHHPGEAALVLLLLCLFAVPIYLAIRRRSLTRALSD